MISSVLMCFFDLPSLFWYPSLSPSLSLLAYPLSFSSRVNQNSLSYISLSFVYSRMSPILIENPVDVQSCFRTDSDPYPVPVTAQVTRDIPRLTPDEELALQVSELRDAPTR